MLRFFTIVPIVAIGLAMPAAAQHVSDQDARQAGESVVQAFNKASQAKDAAGLAALYSEDATYITPDGPIFGRAAIQKLYAEDFKSVTPEPAKLDRVIMIGDTVRSEDRELVRGISKPKRAGACEGVLDNHRRARWRYMEDPHGDGQYDHASAAEAAK